MTATILPALEVEIRKCGVRRVDKMAAVGGSFAGRLALITGGGSGIGRAVCQGLAARGARVAVVDVNSKGAQETVDSLKGDHHHFSVDVASSASVSQLMSEVQGRFSQIPCVNVNCAGITRDTFLLKMNEEMYDQVMDVNMKGTFLVTQAVAKLIAENEIKNGAIVNVSSISGKVGNIGQCNYAASKAGVMGFTKTAAKELAKFGIRCNAVLPGFITTPMTESVPEKVIDMMKKAIPMGRMGTPEEVADVCLYLASAQSSYITGECIEVTGGFMM